VEPLNGFLDVLLIPQLFAFYVALDIVGHTSFEKRLRGDSRGGFAAGRGQKRKRATRRLKMRLKMRNLVLDLSNVMFATRINL
jgi:hypothetical protein